MGGIAALTLLCWLARVNATTVSLAFLLFVLVVATQWGLRQAILSSVAATVCFNLFFLPPVGTLTISDPQNWLALAAFLITAVIASELSNRLQKQRSAAIQQRGELERLYALSRAVLLDTGDGSIGGLIAHQIADIFRFPAVLLYDLRAGRGFPAGPEDLHIPPDQIEKQDITRLLPNGSHAVPVRLGNKPVGVLFIKGEIDTPALEAIANLVAINLEKAASQEAANQARVARKNEELKSSILDALAHEFKTPLTSIKAACTSLLANPGAPPEQSYELLSIVDEEADRLTNLVNDAIQVSRIDAGKVRLTRVPAAISDIVNAVMAQMRPRFEDRRIDVDLDANLPPVLVDRDLIELAVRQLVDNALKYSPPGGPVSVAANRVGDIVRLRVQDSGPGIPVDEQHRIFEKFYRGERFRDSLPGSGVGLSVVKEILGAHSGSVRVESGPGAGTIFTIELPALTEARA